MFLAAKRKNIWQLRRQNFHTRKNDSASYAGYKNGSNLLYCFVLFCFLITYEMFQQQMYICITFYLFC